MDDIDVVLRAQIARASSQASNRTRMVDEAARRVVEFRTHLSTVRGGLILASERTVKLLLAAPNRGGLGEVVVVPESSGRWRKVKPEVTIEGWVLDPAHGGNTGTLLLPSEQLVPFDRRTFVAGGSREPQLHDAMSIPGWIDSRMLEAALGKMRHSVMSMLGAVLSRAGVRL